MDERGESVRAAETASAFNRLEARSELNETTREELEILAARLTAKILEPAVEQIIHAETNQDQQTVETLVGLFDPAKTQSGDDGSVETSPGRSPPDVSSDSETEA